MTVERYITDLDRYITDEAVRAIESASYGRADRPGRDGLRAALPTILARHRADVLREAAGDLIPYVLHPGGRDVVLALRQLAEEAVADGC